MSANVHKKIEIEVPYNYMARDYQLEFWRQMRNKKRAALCWHRRSGKDKTCWNYLISQAVQKIGTYYYFFPHFSQGRKILWDGTDKQGFRLINHVPEQLVSGKPNSTEMKIRLKNGSLIQIIGTNHIDSIVGTNPIGCVFSEYSLQNPVAWNLIRPILAENGGWSVFNGTPRGGNHFKDMIDMAKGNDSWFSQVLTVDDTDAISEEDIEAERAAGMSNDYIQQEFYCSFNLGVEGSYYAQYLQDMRDEERIGIVGPREYSRVYTAWDIGVGDATAIVFFQVIGDNIHIVNYYENQGEGLAHYAGIIDSYRKDLNYKYADHFAPHDIESRNFSSGLSAKEVGRDLGIEFTTLPTLKIKFESGIEALRSVFPRLMVSRSKTERLIKCLENYRKEYDEKRTVYKNRPVHDWASHGADAARYMAIAVKMFIDSRGISMDDKLTEGWFKENNPRFD